MRIVAGALALSLAGRAGAQVVERNLPPAPQSTAPALPAPVVAAVGTDDRPIGPPVRAIALLGARDPVLAQASDGVSAAPGLRLPPAPARMILARYLGRPLSRKLIADAEAAVTRFYRAAGYPFVSISTPEQEVTAGLLQIRVIELRAGQVRATGEHRTPAGYIEGRVRLEPGQPIDADALSQDLDWLNRNPFRQVGAVFSPGDALGVSDLALTVTEVRRWQVYGGVSTSGSDATGRAREFAGLQVAGLPGLPDALLSYQFTASPDLFDGGHTQYSSHAARASLPVVPRGAIELTYDHVATSQPVEDFVSRQNIDEAAIGYRTALTDLIPGTRSPILVDLSFGAEARRATRRLLFGDSEVARARADVFQLYAGYTANLIDRLGQSSLSATLHASPGGIGGRNGDAALAAFSGRPDASATYAYVNGQASRYTRLPRGFAVTTDISFQYAGKALPETEQVALGGPSAVRGFSLDDGGFDSAVVFRNELRVPGFRLVPPRLGGDALQARLFLDIGYGRTYATERALTALSTGVGLDYRLAHHLQLGADAAFPLKDGARTHAGRCRLEARVTMSY